MIKRVLVPLDGSELAERALVVAGGLVEALSGELVLARVVPPSVPGRFYAPKQLDQLEEAQRKEAEAYLASVAERLKEDRLAARTHVLSGEIAAALIAFAKRERCDLVVMSSHGMQGLGWEVFGSVAQKLLHGAPCPVLIVRPAVGAELEREEEMEEARADEALLRELPKRD